jgi:hypothetical protein
VTNSRSAWRAFFNDLQATLWRPTALRSSDQASVGCGPAVAQGLSRFALHEGIDEAIPLTANRLVSISTGFIARSKA